MTQTEVVIEVINKNGGILTLSEIVFNSLKYKEFHKNGKTPQATIRRIVRHTQGKIFVVKRGLYSTNENYLNEVTLTSTKKQETQGHTYYQSLLLKIGSFRNFETFVPNQDKNQTTNNQKLGEISTLDILPNFSYDIFKKRIQTVDVIWFKENLDELMPNSLFEIETTTDIKNSLGKYVDLINFNTTNYIVADISRKKQYEEILKSRQFELIKNQVEFLSFENLVKMYEKIYIEQNNLINL
jgi:hypothetical protein